MQLKKKNKWKNDYLSHRGSQDFRLGGGANQKSHAVTLSETLKEEFFGGGKDIAEWKIRSSGLVLALS